MLLFNREELLENEVMYVLEHLNDKSENSMNRSCWGSDIKEIVKLWINGELWEKYRLMKSIENISLVKEFVRVLIL